MRTRGGGGQKFPKFCNVLCKWPLVQPSFIIFCHTHFLSSSTAITKDTWSTNGMSGMNSTNLTQMGQDLWGKSAGGVGRTPPGLGAGTSGWPTSTSSSANGWGSNGGANGSAEGPCWLLLKNLTPQIDGSTLKTLCNQHTQHGPLRAFHLFLNQGLALAQFTTSSNAQKVSARAKFKQKCVS